MAARYTVGIDLGTSNTVVAYAEAGSGETELLAIEQFVAAGQIAALPLLPSVRYQAGEGELAGCDLDQPWSISDRAVLGRYARELGARVPARLVASAKSWLSHSGVDRTEAILPWGAPAGVEKISPVEASASTLAHVHAAWNTRFPASPLEEQELVLTVPASFDEGARALTLEAARMAGLERLRLLEEPQAAFLDWLDRHAASLGEQLKDSRLVLVCDVGGGTTDLTLIQVEQGQEGPRLTRIGVGDHLMLGGDNMDIALAHLVERRFDDAPLPAARFGELVQRCRSAKETLLADPAPERVKITLLGSGARLVGAARSVELGRDEARALLVDGFLPRVGFDERPARRRSALLELGLPYPVDPAISRHLAAFLARHAEASRQALGLADGATALPDTLLLNGGAFHSPLLAERIGQILADWRGRPLRVLNNPDPDVAVARGAVAHGQRRSAPRPGIGGGAPRSYFLVLADDRAICLLPRGTPEGCEVALAGLSFSLRLGQAVQFHLASTTDDTRWSAGDEATIDQRFVRLPSLAAALPGRGEERVGLRARITAIGTLEVACVNGEGRRWDLAFQLRATAQPEAPRHPRLDEALALLDAVFGSARPGDHREVRQLRSALERCLGRSEDWDLPLLRALFDALWAGERRRRRSAEHERVWLNLAGYCLRPGFGAPLDEWRIERIREIFGSGLQYPGEQRNRSQWWTLWRRIAGGLDEAQQTRIIETVVEQLEREGLRKAPQPIDDLIRLAAALERLAVAGRIELGEFVIDRLASAPGSKQALWWALGRIGSRVSFHGSAQNVVPPDVAAAWLAVALAEDWRKNDAAAFAASQIARVSGDRARDLPPGLRGSVIERLAASKAPPGWIAMVSEAVELEEAELRRSFGEDLPPGLRLLSR